MRLKTRWKDRSRPRSWQDHATVLAVALWRLATEAVLNLENENFQTDTQGQRLDVVMEYLAFALHALDRLCHDGRLNEAERAELVTATALHLARLVSENGRDLAGIDIDNYRERFIGLVNERGDEYAEHAFTAQGPSFGLLLALAHRVSAVMGPRDNRWLIDQVMAIEAPQMLETLRQGLDNMTLHSFPVPQIQSNQ